MVDIFDWNDLDAVRDDLTASYTLANTLDSETAGYAGTGDAFETIGGEYNTFSGTFDGGGFAIADLVLADKGSGSGAGLFGATASGATIQNLFLSGTFDVIGFSQNVGTNVGGCVGLNEGDINNCGVRVDVLASNSDQVGGLAGRNSGGAITNSYALGSVEGNETVGGAVGRNNGDTTTSFAAASVAGSVEVSGFASDPFGNGTATDCYWDTQASGQSTSTHGTGLTTSEMQGDEASTNMGGFDFSNTWDTVLAETSDTTTDGYPILQALDRANQLQAQGIFNPPNPLIVDGVAYDVFVDGTQYSVELQ